MFQHKNFGGQLLWALERGVIVDTEGPEQLSFNQPPPVDAAAPPAAAAAATDQVQQQQQQQGRGGNDEVEEGSEELPPLIQDILAHCNNNLNADDYMVTAAVAPMINMMTSV